MDRKHLSRIVTLVTMLKRNCAFSLVIPFKVRDARPPRTADPSLRSGWQNL